jgi:hypothetical protein
METVGKQLRCPTFTNAQRCKIKRNKIRVRRENVQKKRLHVLKNPSKLVFRGWEEVPDLGHSPITKHTLSGATSIKNSL